MRNIFKLTAASFAVAALAACAPDGADDTAETDAMADTDMTAEPQGETIVAVAQGNPDFSTLVTAVNAADLGATLSGEGPFTVFAPTNAAFDKVGAEAVADLTKPENKEKLAGILTYHVVPGKVMAADLVKLINDNDGKATVTTVQGEDLTATVGDDGNVVLTDANGDTSTVIMTDVPASNGVIHAIDTVVMPAN